MQELGVGSHLCVQELCTEMRVISQVFQGDRALRVSATPLSQKTHSTSLKETRIHLIKAS